MRLLLDTHTVLWFWWNDPRLSSTALAEIQNPDHQKLVSWASAWETAIKISLGKLNIGGPFQGFFSSQLQSSRFAWLGIEERHLELVSRLPFHHRDPFDRLLAAQALADDLTVVSADSIFDAYGVRRIW